MASLCCSARPAQTLLGFHSPSRRADSSSINVINLGPNVQSTPFNFRFKNAAKLLVRQKFPIVYASNNPSEGPIAKEPEGSKSGEASTAQGPPFLTILAGFLAIAFVFWIIGSIVMLLFGLVGLLFSK